ncbi:MAG: MarR family transcriptional regulator [Solirubrobacteraceae bacterium]|jgi:DNA-binding MarR family transcriptional regulator
MTPAAPSALETERAAAAERFALAFKHASAAVRRLRGRDTHRHGELSYAQFGLLFGLAEHGRLSASELAMHADVAPGTATQMLDGLEAAGLIERERSERDRRLVMVSLTPHGSELVATRRALYQGCWADALSEFGADELLTAAAVLDSMRAMFDRLAAADPTSPT